jgi:2-polyprenyl-3-methyl-5-hydroxy-6-metoxy-1,4-benzoquinol methylase
MERQFHQQLIAEDDRAKRRRLYSDFYGRLAEFMEQHQPGKKNWGSFSPELMKLFAPFVNRKTVLDFGCGYGAATFELAKCADRVIAVDVSQPMLEDMQVHLAEKGALNIEPVLLTDESERALAKWFGKVEVLYSNDVVEHLHPEDMREHLDLAWRLLRPGGLYICITPNRTTGPHDVSAHFLPYHAKAEGAHIREFSYGDLCAEFRRAGFGRFRTPVTAIGYNRLRSDTAYRRLLVPPRFKRHLESLWFGRAKKHRPRLLNLFCLNKVVLFAWKP